MGPTDTTIEIDPEILAAGSHNGSTYYGRVGFQKAILGAEPVEVGIENGLRAVAMACTAGVGAR